MKTLRLTSAQEAALASALEHYLEDVDPDDTDAAAILEELNR